MDDSARASSALVPIASEELTARQAFALPPGPALDDYLRREVLGDASNGPTLPYSTE